MIRENRPEPLRPFGQRLMECHSSSPLCGLRTAKTPRTPREIQIISYGLLPVFFLAFLASWGLTRVRPACPPVPSRLRASAFQLRPDAPSAGGPSRRKDRAVHQSTACAPPHG